ncbi:hypothetical protein L209DRAFT_749787, partial [Thermothelomyces heterothallicus CBS 203.75]
MDEGWRTRGATASSHTVQLKGAVQLLRTGFWRDLAAMGHARWLKKDRTGERKHKSRDFFLGNIIFSVLVLLQGYSRGFSSFFWIPPYNHDISLCRDDAVFISLQMAMLKRIDYAIAQSTCRHGKVRCHLLASSV